MSADRVDWSKDLVFGPVTDRPLSEQHAARAHGISRHELRERAKTGSIKTLTLYYAPASDDLSRRSPTWAACQRARRIWDLDHDQFPELRSVEILTLLTLNDYSDIDGANMWAAEGTLCKRMRTYPRRLKLALKVLQQCGLLIAEPRPGRTTQYRFGAVIIGEPITTVGTGDEGTDHHCVVNPTVGTRSNKSDLRATTVGTGSFAALDPDGFDHDDEAERRVV